MRRLWQKMALTVGLWRLQYRYTKVMVGILPTGLPRQFPQDIWQGNAQRGRVLLGGEFVFHRDMFSLHQDSWRKIEQMDVAWQRELHSFAWLRDVVAYTGDAVDAARIRQFIQGWWRRNLHKNPVGRHPEIAGERLANWLTYREFLLRGASSHFRRRVYLQLYHGLIKLEHNRQRKKDNTGLTVLKGLIFSALTLPSAQFLLDPAVETLQQALKRRFLADGGHVSRSPEWHAQEMRVVMEIRAVLEAWKPGSAQFLDEALIPMMAALATVTHPDGSLALFNDTVETPVGEIGRIWQSWRKPQPEPRRYLPQTQFARLQQAASALILDSGLPNPALSRSFYSTLAFEFSSEEERIITNCGGYRGNIVEWRKACKSTAAHSTLSIDNANSWQAQEEAQYSLIFQHEVSCKVEEQEEGLIVDAAFNGYVPYAGLVHYRKLCLSNEGRLLKGLDVLMPHKSLVLKETHRVQIRFHLAPGINIARISRGNIELQTLGGQHWRFLTPKEFAAGVEESVYLGHEGKPQRGLQLCIETLLTGQKDLRVDWELKRL